MNVEQSPSSWERTKDFFGKILDLSEGLDRKGTVEKIRKNIETRGANVWLLISAIMIASIGLDLNSPAVIIGAMLISPLMSPILGIGLSIGINDRKTLSLSIRHFAIAIAVSLITSVIYFLITPFGNLGSEIAARTTPTALDVMVAFFGGIAGIIAVTRKDLINAVPGVAIATALLPPLCVTGFGIANLNWEIAWGSFYLFFLNSTFVSLATYIIVRILRFPYKQYVNTMERRRNSILMVLVSFILIIPSFFKMSEILAEVQRENQLKTYLTEVFDQKNLEVIDWEMEDRDNGLSELAISIFGPEYIPEDSLQVFKEMVKQYNIGDCEVKITQLREKPRNTDGLTLKIKELESGLLQLEEQQTAQLSAVELHKKEHEADSLSLLNIERELKIIYPELERYSIVKAPEMDFSNEIDSTYFLLVDWNDASLKDKKLDLSEKEQQLGDLIKVKMNLRDLRVVRYE